MCKVEGGPPSAQGCWPTLWTSHLHGGHPQNHQALYPSPPLPATRLHAQTLFEESQPASLWQFVAGALSGDPPWHPPGPPSTSSRSQTLCSAATARPRYCDMYRSSAPSLGRDINVILTTKHRTPGAEQFRGCWFNQMSPLRLSGQRKASPRRPQKPRVASEAAPSSAAHQCPGWMAARQGDPLRASDPNRAARHLEVDGHTSCKQHRRKTVRKALY